MAHCTAKSVNDRVRAPKRMKVYLITRMLQIDDLLDSIPASVALGVKVPLGKGNMDSQFRDSVYAATGAPVSVHNDNETPFFDVHMPNAYRCVKSLSPTLHIRQ